MLPSQSQTLAPLVATAIGLQRPNLATIGRRMPGPATAQAAIERAWRFTRNGRVEVADARAGMVRRLTRERKERRLVSFDRVEVRDFPVPMAAAGSGGRAVPWLWASYPEWKLLRGQNRPEQGLRRPLKALLPRGARVVILADRGFGRAERAAVGQGLGFDSLVRIRPDVTGSSKRYRGPLGKYPVPEGIARVLRDVGSRKDRRVRHHIVIRWRPGLPRERDGPWFLMTDREGHAEAVCGLSARRMGVEERFRDTKGRRNGWAMRDTRIQHVERFLLILALAYILRAGLGLRARLDFEPSAWCTNRRARECSALTIGKAKLHRVNYLPDDLLRMVRWATIQVAVKWG